MAEWLVTWPVALVALAVLVLPGLAPAYALGFRGIAAWGAVPAFSGAVVATTAIVLGELGLPWHVAWALVGSLLLAVPCAVVWRLSGRRRSPSLRRGRQRVAVTVAVGVTSVVAVALHLRRTAEAIGGPEHVAQTFDTPYHLNAVRLMLESGDASSMHMTLTQPEASTAFYPGLWHALATSVVQLTGTSIPIAANWVSVVATCVAWPLGMLGLSRVLFGPRPLLLGVVVPLSFAMTQFPNRLLSFGLLYPNVLSYALLPAALSLFVVALIRTHGRGRLTALAGGLLGLVALAFAQPNGVFAIAFVVLPLLVHALVQGSVRLRHRGRSWPVVALPWALTGTVAVALYWLLGVLPMVRDFRGKVVWTVTAGPEQAATEVFRLTAMHPSITPNFPEPEVLGPGTANLVVGVLVVVGAVCALLVARWRWLTFSYGILAGLYVLVRAVDVPLRGTLTGYWYADPQRIAALLPLVGIPLTVVAVGGVAGLGVRLARGSRSAGTRLSPWAGASAAIVLGLLVSVALPRSATFRESFGYVAHAYRLDPEAAASTGLLDARELRFLERVGDIVPEDVAVAGDPWDGSALVWALADREAIYPHMGIVLDEDRALVATALNQALDDPQVCKAVERLDVGYVLDLGRHLSDGGQGGYPGLDGLEEADVARLVARDGDARLYEVTAC
ncbi:DUF6541 family protein [Cellulosimicrobium cellulans]|uniref:DUF6541 family protein n=1 Tax=Cellulosimicrobium cellulans TaxID=1710 RepID=UPI0008485C10|nr:DUF6541 family protein [Cellulosimicrobium cellulans]